MENQDPQTPMTKRALITELISRLHPESDLSDEEVLFSHIYDDYAAYAQVLEDRDHELAEAHAEGIIEGRNESIERLIEDATADPAPLPDLGGANTPYTYRPFASIFDIARGV